jgi:hypothetical protein
MKTHINTLLAMFVFVLAMAPTGVAKIITVDDDSPADFNSIQTAIDSASNGDIIIVQPGMYDENINFLGKNITLTSTNPANPNIVAATIIDYNNLNLRGSAVVFHGSEGPDCRFSGFNVNGYIEGWDQFAEPPSPHPMHATISYCLLQGNSGTCGTVIRKCDGIISNCVIADNVNQSYLPCVAPAVNQCHGLINNCTIVNNPISVGVGFEGTTIIQNCVIYRSGGHGAEIFVGSPNGTVNILYSDIQGGLEAIELSPLPGNRVNWGPGNIDTDPCFVREGYWDFNEPWTFFEGDYHLQSSAGRWDPNQNQWVIDSNTSDCIDAGNPGCPTGSEFPPNGNRINMGVYGGAATASKSPADWRNIADLTNDWVVDVNDLAVFVDYWLDSNECIPGDLNRNKFVDFNDFAIFADDWLD